MSTDRLRVRPWDGLRRFHDDEDGVEALQVVMITAIAALVLILVWAFGQSVINWLKQSWSRLRGDTGNLDTNFD